MSRAVSQFTELCGKCARRGTRRGSAAGAGAAGRDPRQVPRRRRTARLLRFFTSIRPHAPTPSAVLPAVRRPAPGPALATADPGPDHGRSVLDRAAGRAGMVVLGWPRGVLPAA